MRWKCRCGASAPQGTGHRSRDGEAGRWTEALTAAAAPQVVLEATHARTLEWADLSDLEARHFSGDPVRSARCTHLLRRPERCDNSTRACNRCE
ncbi:DUF2237 family protein [Candidatus Poriferisodalis sp.]|uniref:DUF2237 family protein n=1 Tax=Candidatus Poriferisodalis sp. TaxID=3101277 RepID=UPI003B51718B